MIGAGLIYSLFAGAALILSYEPPLGFILGDVLLGVLGGILFAFFTDDTQGLRWIDVPVNMLTAALILFMFTGMAERNFSIALWRDAASGALVGLALWVCSYIPIGLKSDDPLRMGAASLVMALTLLSSPVIAERLFDGALFVTAAVGTRIISSLTLTELPPNAQGFVFGVVLGIFSVALPMLGFAASTTF